MEGLWEALPGLVWALAMGLAIGNFATNPIYRLPRNDQLFFKKPYCGECNTELVSKDLFPVFSWLFTGGKCRYCSAQIPVSYLVTEILVALWFAACYFRFDGFSEQFIIFASAGTALVMLVMMDMNDHWISTRTIVALGVIGALFRVLVENTIYGFVEGAFLGGVLGALIWWMNRKVSGRDEPYPAYAQLMAVAGIWFTPLQFASCLLAWVVIFLWMTLLNKTRHIHVPPPPTVAFAIATATLWLSPDKWWFY